MEIIVLVTGGFDPLHSGHIAYFTAAKTLGNILIVGVNSDEWLTRKKGQPFMNCTERASIINNLKMVDSVITFDDSDNSSRQAILKVRRMYPRSKIIFANGGDRTSSNIPEMDVLDTNLEFQFSIGGDNKLNSSSWILKNWQNFNKTDKVWGYYKVLYENSRQTKVKELVVSPYSKLSLQRHFNRKEFWFFVEGTGYINSLNENNCLITSGPYQKFDRVFIDYKEWHQLVNSSNEPLKIIEIQYGIECIESDIERL